MSLLATCTFFSACVSTPKPFVSHQQSGSWEAKAQAKDLTNDKSYNLSLDMMAVTPDLFRMDVSGTLGISLATMVINKNQVQLALYREKKYYEGALSDHALRSMFKMNLNPRLLMNVCTDSPVSDSGWGCKIGVDGMVDFCVRKSDGFKIQWSERDGEKKRVTLTDKGFELQIVFKSFTEGDPTNVQSGKSPFQFETPKDFTKYQIP